MLEIGLAQIKQLFFDKPAVTRAMDAASRRVLSRFGAYVRQEARHSIRPRRGTSPPGQPPYSHTGLLRRSILFGYDPGRQSVVIGPIRLESSPEAPRLLEYGGTKTVNGQVSHYRPRPFMRPAFAANLAKLPALWRDAILR